MPTGKPVPAHLELPTNLAVHEPAIRQLLRLQPRTESFSATATLPIGQARVSLDLSQAIDVDAERRRLEKALASAQKELETAANKLNNDSFLAKAPADVVEGIRTRQQTAHHEINRIQHQLQTLPS